MKKLIILLAILSCSLGLYAQAGKAVTSAVKIQDENGAGYGIKQIDNKLRVSSFPYTYEISEGHISDHFALFKFGSNPDVGIVEETIWQ